MTSKKDKDDDVDTSKAVLATGAFGDVEHPEEGAPIEHKAFEPAPVDAPEHVEKERK